jgi:hypothetical protein
MVLNVQKAHNKASSRHNWDFEQLGINAGWSSNDFSGKWKIF